MIRAAPDEIPLPFPGDRPDIFGSMPGGRGVPVANTECMVGAGRRPVFAPEERFSPAQLNAVALNRFA